MSKISKIQVNYNDYEQSGKCTIKYTTLLIEDAIEYIIEKGVLKIYTSGAKDYIFPLTSIRNILIYETKEE